MKWIVGLVLLGLAGCVSQEQLARQRQYEEQQYQAQLARRCLSFGITPGTSEFAQCMSQLDQANEQRRAAIRAAILGSDLLNQRQAPIQ
jgi:hypothetical protein